MGNGSPSLKVPHGEALGKYPQLCAQGRALYRKSPGSAHSGTQDAQGKVLEGVGGIEVWVTT